MELVLEGRLFIDGELRSGAIGIDNGIIAEVKKVIRGGDTHIDMGDKIILPGFVDPHVHFRDPGLTDKEDFTTGSLAAIYGGVTCVLDMPNTKPPVTNLRTLEEKIQALRKRSFVDYGLFSALTSKCDPASVAEKVCGFKLFMGSTTGDILMNDDRGIYDAITKATSTGKRISVHAEDDSFILKNEEKNNRDHLRNRPVKAEYSAIQRLARYKGMNINICHVTDASSVDMASSLGFTTEVSPHHIFFHDSVSDSPVLKVNPPLRDVRTRDNLYNSFKSAKITMIGTDHAPHTYDEKHRLYADAPSGIPEIETYVPIFMDMVKKGSLSLGALVQMGSAAPAKAFGINKGMIKEGYDADLVVFNPRDSGKVGSKRLHSKAGYSPYDGWDALFPSMTVVGGHIQLQGGELCGEMTGRNING